MTMRKRRSSLTIPIATLVLLALLITSVAHAGATERFGRRADRAALPSEASAAAGVLYLPSILKPCLTQERNPNDSIPEADGSGNELCLSGAASGALGGGDPRDLFYLTLPAPGPLTIILDGMPQGIDNDLALLNSGGMVLHYSATTGVERIAIPNLPAGRYYVMVYPFEDFGGPYRLVASRR